MSNDCEICCLTIKADKEILCPYCNYKVCTKCLKRYLLESPRTPDCMNCHKGYTLDFVSEITSKSFVEKDYRDKRVSDLLSREKSLLPMTQHLAEQKTKEKRLMELYKESEKLKKRLREIEKEINSETNSKINSVDFIDIEEEEEKEKITKKRTFIMKCPAEDCRGFLSSSWKCGTCGIYACSKCRCIKKEKHDLNHKCDPDDIATTKLLKHDTKPCPKCTVPIYKIDGCDQMFCMGCHTPFSWKTGEIHSGEVYNPHYFRWQYEMQNNNQNVLEYGNVAHCGGLVQFSEVISALKKLKISFSHIDRCFSLIEHVRQVVMRRFRTGDAIGNNVDLRVRYLIKDIDEDDWFKILKLRHKKSEKDNDVTQVLEMFVTSLSDIFSLFVKNESSTLLSELESLRVYTNRELIKISKRYNNKIAYITEEWVCA